MSQTSDSPTPPCPPAVREALGAHTTVTLAYTDADGPGACAVLYAPTAGPIPTLVFLSSLSTRHGRALEQRPDAPVAFTAQRDGQEWRGLTGVQGRGTCRRLAGEERAAAWETYRARFPFVAADQALAAALERTDFWQLTPSWLRFIDNGQGFGHKEEWSATAR